MSSRSNIFRQPPKTRGSQSPQAMKLRVVSVVLGWEASGLKCLLMEGERSSGYPYQLPGAFVKPENDLDSTARDVLESRTGLKGIFLEQLYTFGPLGASACDLSVAYYALVSLSQRTFPPKGSGAWTWMPVSAVSRLSDGERPVLLKALERLKGKVRYQPIGFELLPPKFTLSQLQNLYETVLERSLDKRNFRKKILSMDLIQPLGEFQREVAHRAARLYRFDEKRYRSLKNQGLNFEI